MYVVAGHKGHPQAVTAQGRKGRRNRLKGSRGRGTLAKEKPPILGLIQRNGEVIIKMLANVQQDSIKPIIQQVVAVGSKVFTDEYNIYHRLTEWGYAHQTVNHSQGEYALATVLQNRTSIIIAHRLSTVHAADRSIVLRNGQIIEESSHEALLAQGGLKPSYIPPTSATSR